MKFEARSHLACVELLLEADRLNPRVRPQTQKSRPVVARRLLDVRPGKELDSQMRAP